MFMNIAKVVNATSMLIKGKVSKWLTSPSKDIV